MSHDWIRNDSGQYWCSRCKSICSDPDGDVNKYMSIRTPQSDTFSVSKLVPMAQYSCDELLVMQVHDA